MTKLRAGLIGFGTMGKQHARILSTLEDVNFVGIFDPMADTDQNYRNAPIFRDLEALICQRIDYAVVAAPTLHHGIIARQLAEAGINALIEKPLSHDCDSGAEIVNTFNARKLLGSVGHIERYNPAVIEARQRIEQIGSIYQVATRRQGPFPGRVMDVGVVKDLATHDIDLTRWITRQEYRKVSAQVARKSGRENEDIVNAMAILDQGTIANHLVNWLSPKKDRSITLIGEKGLFEIDTLSADLIFFENGKANTTWDDLARFRGVSEGNMTRFAIPKREPLLIEHENFRDAILGKPSEIVSLEEGLKTVEIAEAILASAKAGVVIQV